jgi:hypothetical protein
VRTVGIRVDRWQWREMFASENGPPSGMTRAVLHAIALHMKRSGDGAFPSQVTIAVRCGFSERVVRTDLKIAQRAGWLEISTRDRPGQGWRLSQYAALVPAHLAQLIPKGAEPGASRLQGHAEPRARRADFEDATCGTSRQIVRNRVPTNTPLTLEELSKERDSRKRIERPKTEGPSHISSVLPTQLASSQETNTKAELPQRPAMPDRLKQLAALHKMGSA